MKNLTTLDWVAMILVIVGGLNWLLVGLFDFNLVTAIFGLTSVLTKIVYVLVGLSAIYVLFSLGKFGKK
ncbi:MAG: DUF378 domain-containing protein [Candidatus Nomurabacteria bacterium]